MSQQLKGKVAIVTGGSTGIGRATALRLASEGATVVITGRDESTLKESVAQHPGIHFVMADVSKPADVKRVIEWTIQNHGRIDILVNNAGIAQFLPLGKFELDHFDAQFATNVRGLVDMTQQALPHLIQSKGVIVNNASIAGDQPIAGGSVYSATKAAVIALSRSWAKELASQGVRVNTVSPGPIETPIFGKTGMPVDQLKEMTKQMVSSIPLSRIGKPEEVASAIAYLASDEARFVTGIQLKIDGGLAA
ncbi:MAG: SDR family oxidoreductase [Leptospirales bacterium]|nr:SDR family oxidoreductase [Leptospirales bacterium]